MRKYLYSAGWLTSILATNILINIYGPWHKPHSFEEELAYNFGWFAGYVVGACAAYTNPGTLK
jgi:hypothetical protein